MNNFEKKITMYAFKIFEIFFTEPKFHMNMPRCFRAIRSDF